MRQLPHHPLRDMLYGDPGRAVPWICIALGVGAGLLTRSPGMGLATVVLGGQIWDRLSPRMVIEDPRLGALTLNCPRHTSSGQRQVWLTFDDGPGPDTEAVLDILEQFGASATFFFIGEKVRAYQDISGLRERLKAGGHKVGNHSWSHPNLLTLDSEPTKAEIQDAQQQLSEAFPEVLLPIFRPPYGYRTESLFTHLQSAELSLVGWSVNSLDFLSGTSKTVVKRVLQRTAPGSILLFHDGPKRRTRTLRSLPTILSSLKAQGYAFGVPSLEDVR